MPPPPPLPCAADQAANPVFNFWKDFRMGAQLLQSVLLRGGFAIVVVGSVWWAGGGTGGGQPGWILPAAGAGLWLCGVFWAYLWRGLLRSGFRRGHSLSAAEGAKKGPG